MNNRTTMLILGTAFAVLVVSSGVRAERIIYVSPGADAGAGGGRTWASAYADLQDALDDATVQGGCPCEVWVAGGVYKPDRGTSDPSLAFDLSNHVRLYGGFAGWEDSRAQRNPFANETILSGDLQGDDDPSAEQNQGCCTPQFPETCDDVECRERVIAAHPECAIAWGFSQYRCGSYAFEMCCDVCHPTHCDNSLNVLRAEETDDSSILDGFTIQGGAAMDWFHPIGGGLYCANCGMTVNRCTFRWNNAGDGAAISAGSHATLTITNSLFFQNGTEKGGGPAIWAAGVSVDALRITDCTFLENRTGAISVSTNPFGNIPLRRCDFVRNDWFAVRNGGFRDIIDCTFIGNTGIGDGAAVWAEVSTRFTNCRFIGNATLGGAGAIYMWIGSATVIDTLFLGNRARVGGAFAGGGHGQDRFINCTVANNSATYSVGGISSPYAIVTNSVLWGNTDQYGNTQYSQLSVDSEAGSERVDFSIVEGWNGSLAGVGSSGVDPLFIDPDGPDDVIGTEDDDLRLSPDSPAINAGDPDYVPRVGETDLDGHARVLCEGVDIGAYEFGIGDSNCDRSVDLTDFANWQTCMTEPDGVGIPTGCEAFDFNSDQSIDLRDFAAFQLVLASR